MLEAAALGNAMSKEDFKAAEPGLRVDLVNAQYDLKSADFPVLLFISGDDRIAGNDVVNRLNEWLDARFMQTHVLGELTPEEAQRPRFWRLWRALPPKGRISLLAGGFVRIVHDRLTKSLTDAQVQASFEHLERFQEALVADGALIIKIFLHTPADVQLRRLKRASKRGSYGWRVDPQDWAQLDLMAEGRDQVDRMLRRTSVPGAPWTIIESTDERYRDIAVGRTILNALTARLGETPPPTPAVSRALFAPGATSNTVLDSVNLDRRVERAEYKAELARLQGRLHTLALKARERGMTSVLAFEGWDAAGKGGAIRRITQSLEAGDYRVISTAAPTEEERKYHYLWRFWRDLPPAGRIAIYDRTWYGRVLVERIEGFATDSEWQRAYDEINDFEDQLIERGYYVAKFWLHISAEEQLARFQARENTPYKAHKITEEDYRNREKWGDYVEAVDQMVLRTTSPQARWHIVPANDKYAARIAVLEHVIAGMSAALKRKR